MPRAASGRPQPTLDTLAITLLAAVPLHILDLSRLDDQQRIAIAHECADIVAAHGDDLQFRGKHCREAFNALARGLAVAAYQPGGITFAGMHWCTAAHLGCPQPGR